MILFRNIKIIDIQLPTDQISDHNDHSMLVLVFCFNSHLHNHKQGLGGGE